MSDALLRDAAAGVVYPSTPPLAAESVATLRRGRLKRRATAIAGASAAAALAAAFVVSPSARSAIDRLLESIPGVTAERVVELEPVPLNVAPPFLGEPSSLELARRAAGFELRLPEKLGAPDAVFVRHDIVGGAITAVWGDPEMPDAALTEWKTPPESAEVQVAGLDARIVRTDVEGAPALWAEGVGEGRATYTVVGADRALHREAFYLSANVLFWSKDGTAFRLEVAADRDAAVALAESL